MAQIVGVDSDPTAQFPGAPQGDLFAAASSSGPGYPSPIGSWCCTHSYVCATIFGMHVYCCDEWEPCGTARRFGGNAGFYR